MPVLDLHPGAAAKFHREALNLVPLIAEQNEPEEDDVLRNKDRLREGSGDPARPLVLNYTMLGVEVARFYKHPDVAPIGFNEDVYPAFDRLVRSLYSHRGINSKLSERFLCDHLFSFVMACHSANHEPSVVPLGDFLETIASQKVESREVWCPISGVKLARDLRVAGITLRPVTRDVLGQLGEMSSYAEKELLGRTCGYLRVDAEITRARELGREKTDEGLNYLRIFSPAAVFPHYTCRAVRLGNHHSESNREIVFTNGLPGGSIEHLHYSDEWNVTESRQDWIERVGLTKISDLALREKQTEFQRSLLKSLKLYGKATLRKNIEDRLLYIFAALESFFLASKTESIQASVGERVAFLAATEAESRLNITDMFNKVYMNRADFFHHGDTISDLDLVGEFMHLVWRVFNGLLGDADSYKTRDELFRKLKLLKFS